MKCNLFEVEKLTDKMEFLIYYATKHKSITLKK